MTETTPAISLRGVSREFRRPRTSLTGTPAVVRAVREEMGPEGRVRIDANGAWNVDEAEHAIHALAEYDLEYVEQPCATIDELARHRERRAV